MRLTYGSAAYVRLKKRLQLDPPWLYYDIGTADWTADAGHYTKWTIMDWHGTFGYVNRPPAEAREWVDPEGRLWEFFGYVIPLYDDTST